MKSVRASLDICVWVDCPVCEKSMNLLDENDTGGIALNDEGQIMKQACPDGNWSEEHENFEINSVKCPECSAEFDVNGMDW